MCVSVVGEGWRKGCSLGILLQMLTVLWCFFPRSGFFLFCSEFRPKIKSTNPGISIGDVAKKLGEMWNNLSDGEKQPYNNKAAKLKEKYEKVRRVWHLCLLCSSSFIDVFLYHRPSSGGPS